MGLVIAQSSPQSLLFFFFSQSSHSVPTVIGLVLSGRYQKTAPNVSLINDSCGWVWFITDLTHWLAHVWVILVLRGLLRESSSKPHQNRRLLLCNSTQYEQPCLFTVWLWKYVSSVSLLKCCEVEANRVDVGWRPCVGCCDKITERRGLEFLPQLLSHKTTCTQIFIVVTSLGPSVSLVSQNSHIHQWNKQTISL